MKGAARPRRPYPKDGPLGMKETLPLDYQLRANIPGDWPGPFFEIALETNKLLPLPNTFSSLLPTGSDPKNEYMLISILELACNL